MIGMLQQLNDNQVALIGCLGAIAASMLLLSVSYHSNPENRKSVSQEPQRVKNRIEEPVSTRKAA